MNRSPCYMCPVRRVTEDFNCHAACTKYLAYRKELDERNAERQKHSDIISYNSDIRQKIRKRLNKK